MNDAERRTIISQVSPVLLVLSYSSSQRKDSRYTLTGNLELYDPLVLAFGLPPLANVWLVMLKYSTVRRSARSRLVRDQ